MEATGSAPADLGLILGRDRPQHCFVGESTQYRVKLQRYSSMPPELTVQRIEFDQEIDRYLGAYRRGFSSVPSPKGGTRTGVLVDGSESSERSMRRAKSGVRRLITELAPSALVTFTTREILTLDQLLWVWGYFVRLTRIGGMGLEYVAVPERHPSNKAHLHVHAAVRGSVSISTLRRLWHIALEARHGRRVTCILRGKESPGNIDVQRVKARQSVARIRKIARYVSKYITKDLIAEFNRKRYWPSRGITLESAKVFWLSSLNQVDAVREACELLGFMGDDGEPLGRPFMPDERVCWIAMDPAPS